MGEGGGWREGGGGEGRGEGSEIPSYRVVLVCTPSAMVWSFLYDSPLGDPNGLPQQWD